LTLNFTIIIPESQRKDFLNAFSEEKKIKNISGNDIVISERNGDSEFKDLHFDPSVATEIGKCVFELAVIPASTWLIEKTLDHFFSKKKQDPQPTTNPIVFVIMPNATLRSLNSDNIAEFSKELEQLKKSY